MCINWNTGFLHWVSGVFFVFSSIPDKVQACNNNNKRDSIILFTENLVPLFSWLAAMFLFTATFLLKRICLVFYMYLHSCAPICRTCIVFWCPLEQWWEGTCYIEPSTQRTSTSLSGWVKKAVDRLTACFFASFFGIRTLCGLRKYGRSPPLFLVCHPNYCSSNIKNTAALALFYMLQCHIQLCSNWCGGLCSLESHILHRGRVWSHCNHWIAEECNYRPLQLDKMLTSTKHVM